MAKKLTEEALLKLAYELLEAMQAYVDAFDEPGAHPIIKEHARLCARARKRLGARKEAE